jgi:GntR family transcriptional regulator
MIAEPSQFRVSPSSGVPIFRQIMDQVSALVASGTLKTGDMLPSTRELARVLEVNMMTVSKAYSRLEVDGLVERVRGTGMRIAAPPVNGSMSDRKREFQEQVAPALHRARQLGLSDEQILNVVHNVLKVNANGS